MPPLNSRRTRRISRPRQQVLDLAVAGPRQEDIAEAAAKHQAMEAGVALLRHRLADTILMAPAPGVIQSRILEPGEMAGPTRPAFILALTDPKWVRTYVAEPDLGRLREGMAATISSDSWPDKIFNGRVGFISSVAEFTPKSVETTDLRTKLVYEVRVLVDDPHDQLKLGMPVTVQIPERARAASRELKPVPESAVILRAAELGKQFSVKGKPAVTALSAVSLGRASGRDHRSGRPGRGG